jgi:hypothetical protein
MVIFTARMLPSSTLVALVTVAPNDSTCRNSLLPAAVTFSVVRNPPVKSLS